jgi:hypothetical protein
MRFRIKIKSHDWHEFAPKFTQAGPESDGGDQFKFQICV